MFLDFAEDNYEDITGLFKRAKGMSYTVYTDEEHSDIPYEGPFTLEIDHHRYVINHTKRLFYDRQRTPVRCVWPHRLGIEAKVVRFDPFPALFAKDSRLRAFKNRTDRQLEEDWVGDAVEASNTGAPVGYRDVSLLYDYWSPSLVADDETVLEAMESEDYKGLVRYGHDPMNALKVLLTEYVI